MFCFVLNNRWLVHCVLLVLYLSLFHATFYYTRGNIVLLHYIYLRAIGIKFIVSQEVDNIVANKVGLLR